MLAKSATPNPSTVLGRQLGDELRRLREAAAMTTSQAADALDCTKGKISRIENGRVTVRLPDLTAMLQAYQVSDPGLRERLSTLARKANRRRREGWWNEYAPVLADTYRDYIALEAMAGAIRTFQAQLVPGLLQTPDYIRAVTVASRQWQTADEIEKFVQVRLARQERLTGNSPLQFWAVLSEAVLAQQVGGPETMKAQLRHLLTVSAHPNVTVQILPFSRGAHASMFGPYVVLGFPEDGALDVVLADNPTGSMWFEREAEVARYRELFDAARTAALSPVESRAVIQRRAREHRS
ncbi:MULTISPECIES: helix-turn-helix domain-containing protein [Streptomyces]|uniref:XRE family transcriptional regulator n=2 Tax=Streptomyces TaxID=1883 RepID=A0A420V6I2_9ACTN|nr:MULTISPECIES: helix-turn-helix transcriptional regulator [Streptomyces]KNE83466.1 DNA-binding protein [Streptomyces fradiae]OFA61949.1 transcriptional regulator [Streptomyces fradiae]PQM24271.1 XRE family transcriptional regulator [Streptomyces xinghaiensis]RKM97236.1 XRE family transcriptional regulator [Streptomyces xinghaiensis]RNC75369.1 XRE family transcriptional regulator [Streptomyces xinghaiensis]